MSEAKVGVFGHPGAGRRKAPLAPKGRQIDPAVRAEIASLLGDRPRDRQFLIEYLHLLQDGQGCMRKAQLVALAEALRLAPVEVFEVATFYAHFTVIDEDETPPPPVTVRVCNSLVCARAGGEALLAETRARLPAKARAVASPCLGACDRAPAAAIGFAPIAPANSAAIGAAAAMQVQIALPAKAIDLAAYRASGGYRLLEACRRGERAAESVCAELEAASLRGLGGAGFPTGRKWRLVRTQPAPRYVVVNADEGEPGTFKDRHLLESDPHRVLEGALLAAWATEAAAVYIYLRDEYPQIRRLLLREIIALEAAGLCREIKIHFRRGAGAYICGEESALLESLEGKRGLPRHKPPYPAEVGLFGRPTAINNVETLFWVRDIIERGAAWWSGLGRRGHKGQRCFSVSGRIAKPGVKIAPNGITLNELIAEHCGGMAEGHRLKAYLPGGASGGILPARLADLPLDFGGLDAEGAFIGSAAVIVLSDRDDLKDVVRNLLRFFEHESCGQCTPCRVGTEKATRLLAPERWDEALLADLAQVMGDASICGLGQAAANPIRSLFRHFREEVT